MSGVQGHPWLSGESRASLVYIPCLKKIRNMVIGGHQQDSSSQCLFYGKILTTLYTITFKSHGSQVRYHSMWAQRRNENR